MVRVARGARVDSMAKPELFWGRCDICDALFTEPGSDPCLPYSFEWSTLVGEIAHRAFTFVWCKATAGS
jgi:hypothetical protein